jgi:protein TonB
MCRGDGLRGRRVVGVDGLCDGVAAIFWPQTTGGGKMKKSGTAAFDTHRASDVSVFTLVVWLDCLVVGGLGFVLAYSRPQPRHEVPGPIKVEMLDVKLTSDPEPTIQPPPNSQVIEPAPASPPIPQPVAVAQPSPAIAFALPVEGPVRVVPKQLASYVQSAPTAAAPAAPAPQPLVFGQGEGKQPAPEYPARARREGQEGIITVRFTVSENGRVIAAEVISPSSWPLLNESALRAVKEKWRFSPGVTRAYDVVIRFELTH